MVALLRAIVLSFLAAYALAVDLNIGFTSYDNDFIEPSYILGKNWNPTTVVAQESIVQWADWLAAQGPWSVTTKPFLAPSNNTHDYLSWAPYAWPDCSEVGNTTELTPQQSRRKFSLWVTCPYVTLDGQFNPDYRTVNNSGDFSAMSDAVLYNALAWTINGSSLYASNVASWINTWFLAPATYMNPNLNYAQVVRGPGADTGTHTGVLDLKSMTKVADAVLILRGGNAPEWTEAIDSGLVNWTTSYIGWLTSNELALQEAASANNHGSYYYSQLGALQILVNDLAGANATIQKYFSTLYQNQVEANGEQPFEAARTRPYHYRCYNLAAMITNARLGAHVGFDAWNLTTATGGTIKAALDFTMTVLPGNETPSELYPSVGAGAAVYGDPQGTYANFLNSSEENYPAEPWFLWNQPLSDSGWVRAHAGSAGAATPSGTASGAAASSSAGAGAKKNESVRTRVLIGTPTELLLAVAIVVLIHVLLFT